MYHADDTHTKNIFVGRELAVSWALCAVCLVGHFSHILGANAPWIHAFHSTGFHLSLCLFTLLGPGRKLILDGVKSLFKGAPNMNTLVGLGALSSFTVSSLAALIPKLVSDGYGSCSMGKVYCMQMLEQIAVSCDKLVFGSTLFGTFLVLF